MNTATRYKQLIDDCFIALKQLNENEAHIKPVGKWSKKEILGHLCDSAINNIYRFMHLQQGHQIFKVVEYEQDLWVDQANYYMRSWSELIQYWYALNITIVQISHSLVEQPTLKVQIGDSIEQASVLVEGYYNHLRHHFTQLLNDE